MTSTTDGHRSPSAGAVVMLVIGTLLTGLGALTLSGTVAAANALGDGQYVTSPSTLFATDTAALTSPGARELAGAGAIPQLPFDLGSVRVRVEGDKPVFVGIARVADVERYLGSVHHTMVTGVSYRPFRVQYTDVPGAAAPADPTAQTFWAASSSGSGPQQITWPVEQGSWAVVVMNQDGSPGVNVSLQGGVQSGVFAPIAAALLAVAGLLLLLGVPLLLLGASGVGRSLPGGAGPQPDETRHAAPVRLTGRADEPLSRWLWLVKWLLAIPHYFVLALLWVAFLVSTVAAGFAVLFTGRYPRSLFAFDVGVLRWTWRVGFYAYSALGTDRYPPFSLASSTYPADLQVDHPEHLSRGLVLVKSWLLVLPHAFVLAALTGSTLALPVGWLWSSSSTTGGGLTVLGALVVIAGVVLLFTRRYPRGLFDLTIGINRWAFRVAVYAALLRDEYPPFRLDQGPDEPTGHLDPDTSSPTGATVSAR